MLYLCFYIRTFSPYPRACASDSQCGFTHLNHSHDQAPREKERCTQRRAKLDILDIARAAKYLVLRTPHHRLFASYLSLSLYFFLPCGLCPEQWRNQSHRATIGGLAGTADIYLNLSNCGDELPYLCYFAAARKSFTCVTLRSQATLRNQSEIS